MQADRTWLSAADTAKYVRKALKADFPGVKFSVRSSSYAGGASIRVGWTDGPLAQDVERTTSLYTGATFDGMTDMKSYHDAFLVDGAGNLAQVHFGADFIFANRNVSKGREALYMREVRRFLGDEFDASPSALLRISTGRAYGPEGQKEHVELCSGSAYAVNVQQIVRSLGLERPWFGERCPGGASDRDVYCPGCGLYIAGHRAPHLH